MNARMNSTSHRICVRDNKDCCPFASVAACRQRRRNARTAQSESIRLMMRKRCCELENMFGLQTHQTSLASASVAVAAATHALRFRQNFSSPLTRLWSEAKRRRRSRSLHRRCWHWRRRRRWFEGDEAKNTHRRIRLEICIIFIIRIV